MRLLRPKFLFAAAAALLLLGLVASLLVGSLLSAPTPSSVPAASAPAHDLRLASGDGLSLAATYWPGRTASAPAILLLHGNGASRAATAANAEWLAARGYAALTIDLRGHGESDSAPKSFGLAEFRDAEAGVAWLRRQGHARVGVIGISLGGASALLGEQGPVSADALVLQAVYPDIRRGIRNRIGGVLGSWPAAFLEPLLSFQSRFRLGVWPPRLSPLRAVGGYRGDVLVIGGGADGHTPPDETRALYAAVPGRKALWIAPGLDHRQTCDMQSEEYRSRLLAFFGASLGAP